MIRLDQFRGAWRLTRQIEDAYSQQTGTFDGVARFEARGGYLLYHETGQLQLGASAPMQAERRYVWREEAGRIVVLFEDGRPFHSFDHADAAADHLCGDDLYTVEYQFGSWPEWRATWRVTGPRKSYEMVSRYRPL